MYLWGGSDIFSLSSPPDRVGFRETVGVITCSVLTQIRCRGVLKLKITSRCPQPPSWSQSTLVRLWSLCKLAAGMWSRRNPTFTPHSAFSLKTDWESKKERGGRKIHSVWVKPDIGATPSGLLQNLSAHWVSGPRDDPIWWITGSGSIVGRSGCSRGACCEFGFTSVSQMLH